MTLTGGIPITEQSDIRDKIAHAVHMIQAGMKRLDIDDEAWTAKIYRVGDIIRIDLEAKRA